VGIVLSVSPATASAMDLWSFNGRCTEGAVKQAIPSVDMTKMRGSAISCDAATIVELDNGRKLVQFVQKRGNLSPPGFGGGQFKYTGNNYSLIVDHVHPQRRLSGKTTACDPTRTVDLWSTVWRRNLHSGAGATIPDPTL
jgi:hypothetical protein